MQDKDEMLNNIADAIRETGNDPHDQLLGYIRTGEVIYITRRNNARGLIQMLDKDDIQSFVRKLK